MNWIQRLLLVSLIMGLATAASCTGNGENVKGTAVALPATTHSADSEMLALPNLSPLMLNGTHLQVVATTSIIGDVVAHVGSSAIALTVLMAPGQDPHSYQPGAADLTAVASADVIFINGWNLEEGMLNDLAAIGEKAFIVPISANIAPLKLGADNNNGPDPHVWFSISHVAQWTENVRDVLSALDPDNAPTYAANAAQYLDALADLETYAVTQLAAIPADRRVLVTNHDALGYFAHDYGFTILGTIIPGKSTLAEPAAADLIDLISAMRTKGACTIFTETSVSDALAQTVAAELSFCNTVQVLPLYTGALGPAGSGADTYITMFRTNVDTIVTGLMP